METPDLDYTPTLANAIHRAAETFGEAPYLVMPDRQLSYLDAERASRRVAKELLARGIGKGTRVGIHFSYGPEWIVACFALARIGAVILPLSTSYKPAELRKTLRHGDVDTLIVPRTMFGSDHLPFVTKAFDELGSRQGPGPLYLDAAPYLRHVVMAGPPRDDDPEWLEHVDLASASPDASGPVSDAFLASVEAEVVPGDWLCVIHTSGTTGEPKGVVHTHGAFVRHCENLSRWHSMSSASVQYAGMPWFWIGGLVLSVGQSLVRGFPLLCLERHDNQEALDLILRWKPVQIGMWGQLLQRFRLFVDASGQDVSSVPALAPPPGGPVDAGLRHNSLGQTESMGPHSGPGPEAGVALDERHRGSFGLRVPHVEHRIVDPHTGDDLPPGAEGEVIVRGYSMSAGLYKKERHEAFDDDGWLHTGDLGYFADGYLFFNGRGTEMIKTLGSNVAPREVEIVLEEQPNVGLAVVIGLPDPERGQTVAAVLVPRPGQDIDVDAVVAAASEELSSYKVPRRVLVVPSDDLPTLGSGKPDKLKLRDLLVGSA